MNRRGPSDRRRRLLAASIAATATPWTRAQPAGTAPSPDSGPARDAAGAVPDGYAPGRASRTLRFPVDHGAHPDFRTEWWYLTAWVVTPQGPAGIQVTFFRSRTPFGRGNPSRFAPRQILFAHAAYNEPARMHPVHAQIARRADGAHARFATNDTNLAIGPPHSAWRMTRGEDDVYRIAIEAREITLRIEAAAGLRPWLQGEEGFSRKGPDPSQASHYYSRPWLAVSGEAVIDGHAIALTDGLGWLDHEFSSTLLAPEARGWDWVGLHLDDGRALMAFRVRSDRDEALWHSAAWRGADGSSSAARPVFEPLRQWTSPRSGVRYPVQMRLTVTDPGGRSMTLRLDPLMDDQEIDSRASTGTRYWEGAVRVVDAESGSPLGRGYLELTGYGQPLRL